ncbi:Gfo/Idh/MocA family protein [Rhodococcoides corynebacterioides]|uniref:Gfo/Idh/MocA family oxidoreductase n=1 Tax=Rhodococcoides corynebacterioides TaxID=53972 RepID=A0ABS7P597_9NOCA|nr:Gfo/Idh/MocA family oxidoreductase [Rhodococcus corynebacterioides]MBY6367605.1 Gfo/Idh/MocA family oxidoreductase [Rhodococcus corynebacterioides]MBY6407801.1 Gfo/Idh/MocA family oxidoreductase [Rhodococcus corynebacterioides]
MRIGLVGAGPWARQAAVPALTAHDDVDFAGVWARRPEAAAAVAPGVPVLDSVDALIDAVDAVAFAVPPEVQAELAVRAAEAGRHVLLDKPIAGTVADAERLAAAVDRAGVSSMVTLTRRFAGETRAFLQDARAQRTVGLTATWLSGALLGGEYAGSAWRHDGGALMDVGPHVVDLAEAVLGPVTDVPFARRDAESDTWSLTLDHDGRVSQVALSMRTPVRPSVLRVSASGPDGLVDLLDRTTPPDRCYTVLLDEFLQSVRTDTPHEFSVHRGLHLQRVLAQVTERLERTG